MGKVFNVPTRKGDLVDVEFFPRGQMPNEMIKAYLEIELHKTEASLEKYQTEFNDLMNFYNSRPNVPEAVISAVIIASNEAKESAKNYARYCESAKSILNEFLAGNVAYDGSMYGATKYTHHIASDAIIYMILFDITYEVSDPILDELDREAKGNE